VVAMSLSRQTGEPWRVALIAGALTQDGAEKQLMYWVDALSAANIAVEVYSLTHGEFYESVLRKKGVEAIWIGRFAHPLIRTIVLLRLLSRFRPHVIQSVHSFTNLYAALAGRWYGTPSIGALRSSVAHMRRANGLWAGSLLTAPTILVSNSETAVNELLRLDLCDPTRVLLLPNVIALGTSPLPASTGRREPVQGVNSHPRITAMFVGRLIATKRLDCFLRALAVARKQVPELSGVIVGDGPERRHMEALSEQLAIPPSNVTFAGHCNNVPPLLSEADMLVSCSDDEGSPNVVLEAMAARLPVITTPAGDAALFVRDGITGYLVPFGDVDAIVDRMIRLAADPQLRDRLGEAGRRYVEHHHAGDHLAERLVGLYEKACSRAYLGCARLIMKLSGELVRALNV
jgi:glycosyltransferase involved in cell wall biosynthesis